MDRNLMQQALQSVLGDGYEAQTRVTSNGDVGRSPSPHDFLQGRMQPQQVAKSGPMGSDLHVPSTDNSPRPKRKARLKPVEYVSGIEKRAELSQKEKEARLDRQAKIGGHLLAAGAAGGVLSLPSLKRHTVNELSRAGVIKPKAPKAPKPPGRIKGALKPVAQALEKHPKAGAALAAGAAGLEMAGLAGDFVSHNAMHRQREAKETGVYKAAEVEDDKITFSKVDDEKRMVFGWCSLAKRADGTTVVDLQGDEIEIEEIEKSAYNYMLSSRKGGNQHARTEDDEPVHVGDCVESMVFTPDKIEALGLPENFPQGWWYGMKIFDDDAWEDVKSGKRKGFSVHGRGRRMPVEDLEVAKSDQSVSHIAPQVTGLSTGPAKPGTLGYEPRTRRQRVESGALGIAGATAAGAGIGSAALPYAAKKGVISAHRAERAKGKLMAVGAVVGGTAGVYSGLHAAKNAAKPVVAEATHQVGETAHQVKAKVTPRRKPAKKAPVKKAWSPVVETPTPEQRRHRRAGQYEKGAIAGAGAAAAGSVAMAGSARQARRSVKTPTMVKIEQGKKSRAMRSDLQAKQAAARKGLDDRLAGKSNNRGVPQMKAAHEKAMNKAGMEHVAARKGMFRDVQMAADAHNLKAGARAASHSRSSGRLALASAGLAGAAGVIHHQRQGSWKSYPGVH